MVNYFFSGYAAARCKKTGFDMPRTKFVSRIRIQRSDGGIKMNQSSATTALFHSSRYYLAPIEKCAMDGSEAVVRSREQEAADRRLDEATEGFDGMLELECYIGGGRWAKTEKIPCSTKFSHYLSLSSTCCVLPLQLGPPLPAPY